MRPKPERVERPMDPAVRKLCLDLRQALLAAAAAFERFLWTK